MPSEATGVMERPQQNVIPKPLIDLPEPAVTPRVPEPVKAEPTSHTPLPDHFSMTDENPSDFSVPGLPSEPSPEARRIGDALMKKFGIGPGSPMDQLPEDLFNDALGDETKKGFFANLKEKIKVGLNFKSIAKIGLIPLAIIGAILMKAFAGKRGEH